MKINFLKKFNQNQNMTKRNLMIAMFFVSVLMISFVSAGITGYVTTGQAVKDSSGVTATLQGVDRDGTATIRVESPTGETKIVRVTEGETATISDGTIITARDLKREGLFRKARGQIRVTPASEIITTGKPTEPIKSGCCECINNEVVSNSQWTESNKEKSVINGAKVKDVIVFLLI